MKIWIMTVISDNESIVPFSLHRYMSESMSAVVKLQALLLLLDLNPSS